MALGKIQVDPERIQDWRGRSRPLVLFTANEKAQDQADKGKPVYGGHVRNFNNGQS
jgi:hypothetical protein